MNKLKLDLDTLTVDSFQVAKSVHGYAVTTDACTVKCGQSDDGACDTVPPQGTCTCV